MCWGDPPSTKSADREAASVSGLEVIGRDTPRDSMATVPIHSTVPIAELLRTRSIATQFQPILSARQPGIVGLEALTLGRLPDGGQLPAARLFRLAAEAGVSERPSDQFVL